MRELIGKSIKDAAAELAGIDYRVVHNCDSIDSCDKTLVTAVRVNGASVTLIVSDFKLSPDDVI